MRDVVAKQQHLLLAERKPRISPGLGILAPPSASPIYIHKTYFVITVSVDGLVPYGAKWSAGTMLTTKMGRRFQSFISYEIFQLIFHWSGIIIQNI